MPKKTKTSPQSKKKPTAKKKGARKTSQKTPQKRARKTTGSVKKASSVKHSRHWSDFLKMKSEVNKSWEHLQKQLKQGASPSSLAKSRNELLLILGECDFMARKWLRLSGKGASTTRSPSTKRKSR